MGSQLGSQSGSWDLKQKKAVGIDSTLHICTIYLQKLVLGSKYLKKIGKYSTGIEGNLLLAPVPLIFKNDFSMKIAHISMKINVYATLIGYKNTLIGS